ncbi:hypothetical protein E6W39_29230 [Kitasatospora acidiphila]|uniref:Phage tail protein n=1 Tax=Kitasatospora acidiphila TaxID=2567942 RepID=A0A540W9A1_9ACTN|nr:hypothetical protein [Kitasatospora acidiphila]TQF05568.1 hypothetical protein E6W39_29230 [Kitasatospora acidiphila]
MTNTPLADWQFDLAGLVIGHGTDIPVSDIEQQTEQRTADVPIPGEDGTFPGRDLLGSRTLRIEAGIRTPGDPEAALALLARLEQTAADPAVRTTAGSTAVLRAKRPGQGVRRLVGRVRRAGAVSMARAVHGWIPVEIEFTATDPAWQADDLSGLTVGLDPGAQLGQGFTAPLRAPITTGVATPEARPGWATNRGDRAAWPSLRITGPVVNPSVWVVETGQRLDLAITLAVGEYLDIETAPGTRWLMLNGRSYAAGALRSGRLDRLTLPPGRSEIRWTALDYSGTSRLAVTWRDTYNSL